MTWAQVLCAKLISWRYLWPELFTCCFSQFLPFSDTCSILLWVLIFRKPHKITCTNKPFVDLLYTSVPQFFVVWPDRCMKFNWCLMGLLIFYSIKDMECFHTLNIIKQPCSVITMMHWQPVFTSAQCLVCLLICFYKVLGTFLGLTPYLKSKYPIEGE